MMKKSYTELIQFESFEDRLRYCMLRGKIGKETFGAERYFNQKFYSSREWRSIRNEVIARDAACDLAHKEHECFGKQKLVVHHINPITLDDVEDSADSLFDLNNLVCVFYETHQIIHYAPNLESLDVNEYINSPLVLDRRPGDTCPWSPTYKHFN